MAPFLWLDRLADPGNAYIFDAKDILSIKQENLIYYNHDLILYNQDFQNEYKNRQVVLDIINHEAEVYNSQLKNNKALNTIDTLLVIFLTGACIVIAVGFLTFSG